MKIEIELSDEQEKILLHDLLDIEAWINGAIQGKINNCASRAANAYRQVLKAENAKMVPVDDTEAFIEFAKRDDYMNRAARDQADAVVSSVKAEAI